MSAADAYAENYADYHAFPQDGEPVDERADVGDAKTWADVWHMIFDAYEAGWDQAMNQARESLR